MAVADTGIVVTVKVAVVDPAATATEAGTLAFALLLERVTVNPPVGAAPVIVTVPVEEAPPVSAFGLSATDDTADAVTAMLAVLVLEP